MSLSAPSTPQRYDRAMGATLCSERIDRLMHDLAALPPGPRRSAARERVIGLLVPLARRVACRFRAHREDHEDLVQVASLGLVKAVDGYDPALGHAFLSYALPTIVGEIKRHMRDHSAAVRLPRPLQEARARIFQASEELEQLHGGRSPSLAEIAEHTGLETDRVTATLRAVRECSPRYLDAAAGDGDHCAVVSLLGGEDPELGRVVDTVALTTAVKRLPERDRRVLYLRFYHERTQQEIAGAIGVSQMQVSRILARCFQRLRAALTTEPEPAPVDDLAPSRPLPHPAPPPSEDREPPVPPPLSGRGGDRPSARGRRRHSDAVFSSLTGGAGHCTGEPKGRQCVRGGSSEDGTPIRVGRRVTADSVIECRDALAIPTTSDRLVIRLRVVQPVEQMHRTRGR
ncbi:SigB/SigF/SigG family RNA polymerase sigma factor [Streptomyces sp. NPDC006197]|uniref:SigB/SigF/SigG family RNA polymerase sigma factor n=1 Tax=Streptomyces sp. NPDC006197 TaxID=3156685 RepID=UPI0033B52C23